MSASGVVSLSYVTRRIASNALPIAILAIVIAFTVAQPAFINPDNLIGIVRQVALVGIMATCTTFVIMTGGVDLSVGPVLAASGLVSYYCLEANLPLVLVILAGLSVGVLVGLVNGAAIASLQLPPIIVTLAMLSIVRGSALMLGGPEQHLIRDKPEYTFIGAGNLFGVPFPIFIFALGALAMIFLQRRTPLGLLVAAIGDNERAAYLSGHRTRVTKNSRLRHLRIRRGARRHHPVFPGPHRARDLRPVRHRARRNRRGRPGWDEHHGGRRLGGAHGARGVLPRGRE